MFYFLHGVNYLEFLCCWYNYSYGPNDKINNLMALIKEMVFRKIIIDMRGKAIPKIEVITKNNGGSQKKGCQCAYISSLQLQIYVTTRRDTSMQ